jgi:hypothetical protein
MGLFDIFKSTGSSGSTRNAIKYGGQKKNGGHIHTTNKGNDRTPAQKNGDNLRRGPRKK